MSMKIVKMETSSFWKGEAGVKGLVEDQARTFRGAAVSEKWSGEGLFLYLCRREFL